MKNKKLFTMLMIISVFLFIFAVSACAAPVGLTVGSLGEWFSIVFTWGHIGEILAVLFAIMIAVTATKYQRLVKEITDVFSVYVAGKKEDSPGGKKFTKEEKSLLFDEIIDAIKQIIDTFSGGLISKVGSAFAWVFKKVF